MADQGGISKLAGNSVPGVSGQATVDAAQARAARSSNAAAGQGAGRREAPNAGQRQYVNLDGQQLNRAAPRGTYVNITV